MTPISRRDFLKTLATGSAALVALRFTSGCEFVDVESFGTGGDHPFVTPQDDGIWFWQSGNSTPKENAPQILPDEWRLQLTSGSQTLGELTYPQLRELGAQGHELTYWKTLRCVFSLSLGPLLTSLIANGLFTGVPLSVVLEATDIPAETLKIRTYGADGFSSNIPLSRIHDNDRLPVMLAYELNGEPLTRLRGGPVRLIIPEMWGYKNMKWLDRLDFSASSEPFGVYETVRFRDVDAIDAPGEMALANHVVTLAGRNVTLQGADIVISGVAVSGGAAITEVRFSVDDGPEQVATLLGDDADEVRQALPPNLRELMNDAEQQDSDWPLTNVWVRWSASITGLSPGAHTFTVRAIDSKGRAQEVDSGEPLTISQAIRVPFSISD
ncbi:hypothetical protein DL240_05325 [Lujinxingia litoralis]|uniref:Oxidoreductase molybdopterin-binding domain-containing protein n=1 Tax=Lujinxingia litoralis TaxID=2211119 RepID=A0A328CCH1_9DELT|nr:molybdopterin-dependent oxidoreductase [Lujinxingia litoralis]RAL23581.1 hypothetical protein DL240_05325 [Lujinxingia litoralis]